MNFNSLESAILNLTNDFTNPNQNINNSSISGLTKPQKLSPNEDPLKNKKFLYKDPTKSNLVEVVDYTFEKNGKYYVYFKSGNSVATEFLLENMKEFSENDKTRGLAVEGEPPLNNYQILDNPPDYYDVFPKTNLNLIGEGLEVINKVDNNQEATLKNDEYIKQNQKKINDPFLILFSKLKKEDMQLSINLKAPLKNLTTLLLENFEQDDNEDIYEKIANYIFENNFDNLKNSIIELIKDFYK